MAGPRTTEWHTLLTYIWSPSEKSSHYRSSSYTYKIQTKRKQYHSTNYTAIEQHHNVGRTQSPTCKPSNSSEARSSRSITDASQRASPSLFRALAKISQRATKSINTTAPSCSHKTGQISPIRKQSSMGCTLLQATITLTITVT